MAHARRKFFDLQATNKSHIAEKALHYIAALYEVEREVRELEPGVRQRIRQEKAAPIIDAFHTWMIARRQLVPEGSAIAKALDYSGKRAAAIMSLIQSAWLNGHDPYAYLKDVLTRLPTQRASEITELLPHRWVPV
ncbi:hypothetical protein OKW11_005675 [Pseudomonas baetica]|nr:hypothetical protein [Pseudomonas baetica]